MTLKAVTTPDLTTDDRLNFDFITNKAYDRIKDVLMKGNLHPKDIQFYLYFEDKIVSVGRLRYIYGVQIDGKSFNHEFWGRATIAVDPAFQRMGYGKTLVTGISDYAKERKMWVVGTHGKKSGLSSFYKKCGLEVNEDVGAKIFDHKKDPVQNMAHTNFSHFKDDPFIKAVTKATRADILFSW